MKIIIEHLGEKIWTWIYLEYENISHLIGREKIIFSNIKDVDERRILNSLGIVWSRSILDYEDENRLIILDPNAEETLRKDYIGNDDYLVTGGILGDYPPKGRTYKYITKKILLSQNLVP